MTINKSESGRSHWKFPMASMRSTLIGLIFSLPWTIGFIIFGLYPIAMSFYYSFTDFSILQPPNFIGMQNFRNLFEDPIYTKSVYNTLYITVLGVPLSIIVGIFGAILLNQKVRMIGIFRTLIYLPSIVPSVAVAIVWIFILNPNYGLLNSILSWLHLPQPGWLASPTFSKPSMLLMSLWQSGQVIIILLAGLQDIPASIYESAKIDGARAWTTFRHITLPMLSPVIFYNVILGIINFIQFFAQAFVATSSADVGGPSNSTMFYTLYMYINAFTYLKMGYASAMGWGLLIITLLMTVIVFRVGNRSVFYGGDQE